MKLEETRIELETPEDFHFLGIPLGAFRNGAKCFCSYEGIQDVHNHIKTMTAIRTSDPTDEEIQEWNMWHEYFDIPRVHHQAFARAAQFSDEDVREWRKWNEYFDNMDWKAAYNRVSILTKREEPYQDYDWAW